MLDAEDAAASGGLLISGYGTDRASLTSAPRPRRGDITQRTTSSMPEPKEPSAKPDDEELTLDLDVIPEEVLEYARCELGETDEVKCQTIHELREMIYGKVLAELP